MGERVRDSCSTNGRFSVFSYETDRDKLSTPGRPLYILVHPRQMTSLSKL